MTASARHIQDRLGNALLRLANIARRAAAAPESPKFAARLIDDVQKLTVELERSFEDVREVLAECSELERAAAAAARRAALLFDLVPVPCLVLELTGEIAEANAPAVHLLNVSRRHLIGRSFHLYLGSEREVFLSRLRALQATEGPDEWTANVRPRERSPLDAHLTAALEPGDPGGRVLVVVKPVGTAGDVPARKWRAPLADVPGETRMPAEEH